MIEQNKDKSYQACHVAYILIVDTYDDIEVFKKKSHIFIFKCSKHNTKYLFMLLLEN